MKKVLLIIACMITASAIQAQKNYVIKPQNTSKYAKNDRQNVYNAESISTLDVLQALEMAGIKIVKIDIPKPDKERGFGVVIDEFSKTNLLSSDTTWFGQNTYVYWEAGDTTIYKDFIDEITIFTQENEKDSTIMVRMKTCAWSFGQQIKYKPENDDSFYNIRNFAKGEFKYGEKIPLIAIASSWYDEKIEMSRFCGQLILSTDRNDKGTKELLESSPNYYIISYIIQ